MSIKLSEIKPNPKNPRVIKDDRFKKLVKSIQEFPKMMSLRPMVVDENNVILGGNMRYRAIQSLGMKDIPDEWVKRASELTEDEKQRFIIADNVDMGEWDWEELAEWDKDKLKEWGLESRIDNLKDGEEIEVEQSIQLKPPMEYIMIMAEPNSKEWEELKEKLKLKMVRRGGYKEGSAFDDIGLERVLTYREFIKRIYDNSDSK